MKKVLTFIFEKAPFLKTLSRCFLGVLADTLIYLSNKIGLLYTLLFGFLGTSWYDHRFDQLRGIRNYHWLERAFFTIPKISENDDILDIGCGDGIYSGVFYSEKAKNVLAIDINEDAIIEARRHYNKRNVKFMKKNVLTWEMPEKAYNLVTMFAVIEHFTPKDGQVVLNKIKKSLKNGGVLYGSTPILKTFGIANFEHKNEFTSEQELKLFLGKIFSNVKIIRSFWSEKRSDCYFECRV